MLQRQKVASFISDAMEYTWAFSLIFMAKAMISQKNL